MLGLLVVLGLIVGIVWIFVGIFNKRVRRRMDASGVVMPAELVRAASTGVKSKATGGAAQMAVRAATALTPTTSPTAAPPPAAMPRVALAANLHFILTYEVSPDFVARRAQFRDAHLALAWQAAAAGELLLAGALEEGAGQAMLLFRGSREAAMRFAQSDPYVKNGLVVRWSVRQWHTVAGDAAAMPVRPTQAAG